MSKIVIYEPAMCCSTGVCGPSVNPELLRIASVIENLKKSGVEVTRYNLSSAPQEFIHCEAVTNQLNKNGADILPITMIDGKIIKTGSYPTNEEFARLLDIKLETIQTKAVKVKVTKCNCGPKGCC